MYDYQDANGKYMFREFFDIVNQNDEGFTTYKWQVFDNNEKYGEKLSYIRLYAPKGILIGTGEYLDDINLEIASIIKKDIELGFSLIVFFCVYFRILWF